MESLGFEIIPLREFTKRIRKYSTRMYHLKRLDFDIMNYPKLLCYDKYDFVGAAVYVDKWRMGPGRKYKVKKPTLYVIDEGVGIVSGTTNECYFIPKDRIVSVELRDKLVGRTIGFLINLLLAPISLIIAAIIKLIMFIIKIIIKIISFGISLLIRIVRAGIRAGRRGISKEEAIEYMKGTVRAAPTYIKQLLLSILRKIKDTIVSIPSTLKTKIKSGFRSMKMVGNYTLDIKIRYKAAGGSLVEASGSLAINARFLKFYLDVNDVEYYIPVLAKIFDKLGIKVNVPKWIGGTKKLWRFIEKIP